MERRTKPRAGCRIPCDIARRGERGSGTVMDVSEGGLSVHTELAVEQGETLELHFRLPSGETVDLEAMVWHLRRARRRDGGQAVWLLGLMIAKAPDAYLDFVPRSRPRRAREAAGGPAGTAAPDEDPAVTTDASTPLRDFKIRVKARSGPRSRTLCLTAASRDEAVDLARTELGSDWEILEAREG